MDVAPGRAVIRQRGKLDARLPAFGDVEVGRRSSKLRSDPTPPGPRTSFHSAIPVSRSGSVLYADTRSHCGVSHTFGIRRHRRRAASQHPPARSFAGRTLGV